MEEIKKIKVIIVDDQVTVIDGYKARLNDANLQKEFNTPIEILGDFQDDETLFQYLENDKNTKPDIILLDMKFNNLGEPYGGIRIAKKIKHKFKDIAIIIVSGEFDYPTTFSSHIKVKDIMKIIIENSVVIAGALDENTGARGFISRNAKTYYEDLFRGIRCINRGEEYFFNSPVLRTIIAAFLQYIRSVPPVPPHERAKFFELDAIDLTYLRMLAKGKIAEAIADDLAKEFGKAPYNIKTIHQRQARIASKLGVDNNSNVIIVKAIKEGLLSVNDIDL